MKDLQNKKIVVLGGKGLIGAAVKDMLLKYGAKVNVVDPNHKKCYDILKNEDDIKGFVNCAYPKKQHLDVFIEMTELFCEYFKKEDGVIVNLASIYGVIGPDDRIYKGTKMQMPASYSAIKGGIIAHTRTMACKYGEFGVRVNCVSPGGVIDKQPAKFIKRYEDTTPLRRMAAPNDIAGPIVFLLSKLSAYITAQNIIVDGGRVCW